MGDYFLNKLKRKVELQEAEDQKRASAEKMVKALEKKTGKSYEGEEREILIKKYMGCMKCKEDVSNIDCCHCPDHSMTEAQEFDSQNAEELMLFADNDSKLYKSSYLPIVKTLKVKLEKGDYDIKKAAKIFLKHAKAAAQAYVKEVYSLSPSAYGKVFAKKELEQAALEWAEDLQSRFGTNDMPEDYGEDAKTAKELKRGLGRWVKDYDTAKKAGNKKLAGELKDQIDKVISSKGLDSKQVYNT